MIELTKKTWTVLAIGWTLGILIACTIPGSSLPSEGWDLFEYDKLAHFSLFAGFGWLWMHALSGRPGRSLAIVLGTGTAYGILTEFYQAILPWERMPDPLDAIANVTGLVVALLIFHFWKRNR